jgi:hypothetical protein
VCDLALATLACWIEKEALRRAAWIIPMRFVYRPILSYVIWRSILHMLRGAWVDGEAGPQGHRGNADIEILKIIYCALRLSFWPGVPDHPLRAFRSPNPRTCHLVLSRCLQAHTSISESKTMYHEQIDLFEQPSATQAIIASSHWGSRLSVA